MKAAQLIEQIARIDKTIKEHELVLRELKSGREKLGLRVLKIFEKGKIDTQRCGKLSAEKRFSAFPSIKDHPKFLKYVIKNEAYDLFQNRVSATALKERETEGKKVPGVEVFKKFYISVKVRR